LNEHLESKEIEKNNLEKEKESLLCELKSVQKRFDSEKLKGENM
jgi:hypothetical protein